MFSQETAERYGMGGVIVIEPMGRDRRGDMTDVEGFLTPMAPRLRRYLQVLTGSLDDSEDILQGVFTEYLTHGPPPSTEQAERWLFTVGRNRALNLMRDTSRRRERERTYAEHNSAATGLNPVEVVVRSEELARIQHCLMAMSADLREALFLKVVEGASYSQLAECLGIARSTASARVGEALVQLNRCFHGARHEE